MCRRMWCLPAFALAVLLVANESHAQLKGWWKLDSNPPLIDEVGQHDATLIGEAFLVPGVSGMALQNVPVDLGPEGFLAATGAEVPGSQTSLAVGLGDQTISAWVKYSGEQPTGVGTPGTPGFIPLGAIAGQGYIGGAPGMGIFVVGATQNSGVPEQVDHIQVQINAFGVGQIKASTLNSINDGQWHHVVGVFERQQADGLRLYIDGALQSITASTIGVTGNIRDPGSHFAMATSSCCGAGYAWPLNGAVDEVQVYGHALTQEDITFLYNNPGSAIPEPAAIVLFGLGGVALLFGKRPLRRDLPQSA